MEKLAARWDEGKFVCVGLDSDFRKIPGITLPPEGMVLSNRYRRYVAQQQLEFNKAIVDATADIVCAYKSNSAFYEAPGWQGLQALEQTFEYIRANYPHVVTIVDYKRGDIGNTNAGYVSFAFDILGADAVTVHPYLGREALQPFLDRADKGIIVLCRTSNSGGGEFQDLQVTLQGRPEKLYDYEEHQEPLYIQVAKAVKTSWNANGNCALVVGATYPHELAEVRKIVGDMPLLIPGIGAQGGDVEATVQAGQSESGQGMIINSSRGIIFADNNPETSARTAREKTWELHNLINQCRHAV